MGEGDANVGLAGHFTFRRDDVEHAARAVKPPFARGVELLEEVHCAETALLAAPSAAEHAIWDVGREAHHRVPAAFLSV